MIIKITLLFAFFTILIIGCKERGQGLQNNNLDSIKQTAQQKQKQLEQDNDSLASSNLCISTIKTSKGKVFIDEPIFIFYSIKNISKDTISIWHSTYFDQNNRIVVTNDNNIEIPRTGWGDTALLLFSPGGPRDKNFPVRLASGQIDSFYEKVNLKNYFIFKKTGIYKVRYFYHAIEDNIDMKIESNILKIEIEAR